VDLREKRQHDLARQMATVKRRTRPWRAIIAGVLALLAAAVRYRAPRFLTDAGYGRVASDIVTVAAAAAFCLFGLIAIIALAGKAREVLQPVIGAAHAAVIRYAILLIAGTAVLLLTLDMSGVPVNQLILGGAVTGILIGIAGQQSLANVFAGMVLLLSRPFAIGDSVQLRSGALGGQIEGTVTEIGITYLRLDTEGGALHVPNSQVLAAAVGPTARPARTGPAASVMPPGNAGPVTGSAPGPSPGSAPGSAPGNTGPPGGGQPPGLP
jgi:small-conductance mechanosensitive channel